MLRLSTYCCGASDANVLKSAAAAFGTNRRRQMAKEMTEYQSYHSVRSACDAIGCSIEINNVQWKRQHRAATNVSNMVHSSSLVRVTHAIQWSGINFDWGKNWTYWNCIQRTLDKCWETAFIYSVSQTCFILFSIFFSSLVCYRTLRRPLHRNEENLFCHSHILAQRLQCTFDGGRTNDFQRGSASVCIASQITSEKTNICEREQQATFGKKRSRYNWKGLTLLMRSTHISMKIKW